MTATVPAIEAADYRHSARVGRPHGEAHALHTVDFQHLRAEYPADLPVIAFGKQVHVQLAQLRTEAVGVFGDLLAAGPANLQQVGLLDRKSTRLNSSH